MSLPQLIDDLQRLSEDQDSADLVFICGRDERIIYAHRLMLMARCKSFKTAKRGEVCRIPGCTVSPAAPGASAPTTIRLPHVNPDLFRQFILYVYTAKLVLQDSQVFQMMMMAQDMGVVELRTACEDHVISTLSVDNACTFLTAVMDIHEKAGRQHKSFNTISNVAGKQPQAGITAEKVSVTRNRYAYRCGGGARCAIEIT
ncbi:BTB/POZ domain-containing protein 9 [Drosophila madeirensis]|uniref:BTB/POZ domain-containing protein 9 n=1 Tax=Drosophila madeirensis TaxID=30013 RepID=A0AAU9FKB6_DROMD